MISLQFLQHPSRDNEQNNRFVQPPRDVNQFLEKYDHEINYNRDFPNNKGRRKSQPTHPDYEQYEQYEQYEGARGSEDLGPGGAGGGSGSGSGSGRGSNYNRDEFENGSLLYAQERSASRNANKRNNAQNGQNIDENDVSFVSDSKLLPVDARKKSLSTEQSMASESLLMYVGDNNSRMKSKVPTGKSRPSSGGTKPEKSAPVRTFFLPSYF